ncbi:MAG: class SAM-dependent methyltransferase [Ilumatobacteraceae bacterium]|nr:class SAM-dependent methyltransferase [Ilumatobacteraceae bacterium]
MNSNWWLDEAAHAGLEHLDPQYVAGYEAKAGYDPAEDIDVLQRHGLDQTSVVVDLGAGTGRFTVDVAPHCAQVIAVDVSPAMVDALRLRVRGAGRDNVTVVQSGFLSYRHAGPPADFVFTRNALHQIPDFWKGIALDRIAALLRPGGIMRLRDLIFDFEPSAADDYMVAWMAGATDDSATGWTADELAEHVRLEYSTYSWLFEPMLERTGFQILEREYVRSAYGAFTCRRS